MVWFYGISTIVDHSIPNPLLYIQTIQLSISSVFFVYTQLNVKTVLFQTIQFNVSTVSMSKNSSTQTIQFSIQKQFHFKQFSLASVQSLNLITQFNC